MAAALHDRRTRARVGAAVTLAFLGAGFGFIALTACGSSDASGGAPAPSAPPATAAPSSTSAPVPTDAVTTTIVTVTESDVADLEKQLDEIDQLLNGVDADLAQD